MSLLTPSLAEHMSNMRRKGYIAGQKAFRDGLPFRQKEGLEGEGWMMGWQSSAYADLDGLDPAQTGGAHADYDSALRIMQEL